MTRRRKAERAKAAMETPTAPDVAPLVRPNVPGFDRTEVVRIEQHRAALEAERADLDQREATADAQRAAAEETIETSIVPDEIQAAIAAVPRLDAELRAIANRRPAVHQELLHLGGPLQAAKRDSDRRGLAATLVLIEPGLRRLKDDLGAIDVLRRRAVDSGAPEAVAPGRHGNLAGDSSRMLDALDRLAAMIEELWPIELEDAKDLLQGRERQRLSQVASIDRDLRAQTERRIVPVARQPVTRPTAPTTVRLSTGRELQVTDDDRLAVGGMALPDAIRALLERRSATPEGAASPLDPEQVIRYLLGDDLRALADALGTPIAAPDSPADAPGSTGYSPADIGRAR